MTREQNLVPLKILVISLAVLLVGGMAVLGAALMGRMHPAECKDAAMNLPANTNMNILYNDAKIIRVLVKNPDNQLEMITIDACDPTKHHSLRFTGDAGKAL